MGRQIIDLTSALLILLFVYAGLTKLLDYDVFRAQLGTFSLVRSFAGYLAWALPVTELILAFLLLRTNTRLWGFFCSFLLLGIFSAYILYMLHTADVVPCACSGVFRFMSWIDQLKLNILFLSFALFGIVLQLKQHGSGKSST